MAALRFGLIGCSRIRRSAHGPVQASVEMGQSGFLHRGDSARKIEDLFSVADRYVDFCGEYTAGMFGHSEPRILAALHAAIDRGLNLASVGERECQLAALLCERFPSFELVRFTNSGTEANMIALGAARAFTGRPRVLAAGIYIARRGMIAMSLPIGDAECDRLAAAVDEFCSLRQPFMPIAHTARGL